MNEKMQKIQKSIDEQLAENLKRKNELLDGGVFVNDDGYPTDDALEIIKLWHWDDARGWFKFIESLWAYHDWGWKEKDEPHEWEDHKQYKDKIVHRYYISTAGWSGNESIIRAMQDNDFMWYLNWVQSRRGGHYIFELREFNDKIT
jgi:hypothetical protein